MQPELDGNITQTKLLNEILNQNRQRYSNNNALRIGIAQEFEGKHVNKVFSLVPFLLHFNLPELPGYVDSPDVPIGIYRFQESAFVKFGLKHYALLNKELRRNISVFDPVLQSLLLMGSFGTVGYNSSSDLDYWVCLNEDQFSKERLWLYRQKLDAISAWAQREHSVEANFYLVNAKDITANRVKSQGQIPEGEVAPLLLKDEFYRTVLHVCGRIPLWWCVPPGLGHDRYVRVVEIVNEKAGTDEGFNEYIDFGYPVKPEPRELLAAALWLSEKSEADPFKAVLKMILIAERAESGNRSPLLCDLIKMGVLQTKSGDTPFDPYILMIRKVMNYSGTWLMSSELEMVRISAFYKLLGALDKHKLSPASPKAKFIGLCCQEWGWSDEKIEEMYSYSQWSHWKRLELGRKLKDFLFALYTRISTRLENDSPELNEGDIKGLSQLKAGAQARYSKHRAKVEGLPSNLNRQTLPRKMTMVAGKIACELFAGRVYAGAGEQDYSTDRFLMRFTRASFGAAWLIHNRLYGPDFKLWMQPRPGRVSQEAIQGLLETLNYLFTPLESTDNGQKEEGARRSPWVLALNLEEPWHERRLMTVDVINRTAWGEMRNYYINMSMFEFDADKYRHLLHWLEDNGAKHPGDIHVFSYAGSMTDTIKNNLEALLPQAFNRTLEKSIGVTGLVDMLQVDSGDELAFESSDEPLCLVADSDLTVLDQKAAALKQIGYKHCLKVENGYEALAVIRNFNIDVLICSLELPEIDGLSLIKNLQDIDHHRLIPVLLTAQEITAELVAQLGASINCDVMVAPFNVRIFKDKVTNLVAVDEEVQHTEFDRNYRGGTNLMKEGRYSEALIKFESCLSMYDHPEVYFNIGYIKSAKGDYSEALKYFRVATKIDNNFARAYNQMAMVYDKLGNVEMSCRCLQKTADIFMERKQDVEAEKMYEAVIKLKPDTTNVYNSLGIVYRRQRRFTEALEQFEKALRVHPNDEHIYFNMSRVLMDMGQTQKAVEKLDMVLKLNPDFELAKELLLAIQLRYKLPG